MHEPSSCDITKWHQNHLLPLFSGKSIVHVQESCTDLPVHLPASLPTIFYHYAWTMLSFLYPKFWACDIYTYCLLVNDYTLLGVLVIYMLNNVIILATVITIYVLMTNIPLICWVLHMPIWDNYVTVKHWTLTDVILMTNILLSSVQF